MKYEKGDIVFIHRAGFVYDVGYYKEYIKESNLHIIVYNKKDLNRKNEYCHRLRTRDSSIFKKKTSIMQVINKNIENRYLILELCQEQIF